MINYQSKTVAVYKMTPGATTFRGMTLFGITVFYSSVVTVKRLFYFVSLCLMAFCLVSFCFVILPSVILLSIILCRMPFCQLSFT
jgi:hypothetical protein